jgi:PIN domain nuclease of toxin-antitoxin system
VGRAEVNYLLDTCVWVRGLTETSTIPQEIRKILGAPDEQFGLSAISLWEVGKKSQRGKLQLKRDLQVWLHDALRPEMHVLQITPEVVVDAMRLPDFPTRDPADELIVATARVNDLTLLTTDTLLKNYRHARIRYFKPIGESVD